MSKAMRTMSYDRADAHRSCCFPAAGLLLLLHVAIVGCDTPAGDSIKDPSSEGPRPKAKKHVELHFSLDPEPRLRDGSEELVLPDLAHFVASRKGTVTKWTVYLPDDIPVDTAIELFANFQRADCPNVAVYAEDARGDWPKRDIGVEVGRAGPVRVVTEFAAEYPETLNQYVGAYGENLLVAERQLDNLGLVLRPLLAMAEKKHVRLQETGGLDGMPAARYVKVLGVLKELDVEAVSFWGAYVE
jgi:hypothetical protein